MEAISKIFKELTSRQCSEFGLVAVAVTAILAWYLKSDLYIIAVIILSLVTLLAPILFYPFAAVWYALGHILNYCSSRLLLTVIFFVVVVPVAFIRRISGKDSLKLRQFKKEKGSVLVVRDHLYSKEDLRHTF